MNISVITPTVRPEMLSVLCKCLKRQTFMNSDKGTFEWIVSAPQELYIPIDREIGHSCVFEFVAEPKKREGDYYRLNGAWNAAYKKACGDLIVSIVDGLWFPPDTLEKLWYHYQTNPKVLVGGVGHQYDQLLNGKPEHKVWDDPRMRSDFGAFYEIGPQDLEWCISSIPKQALLDIGGIDEEFDKYAALSEKEACARMSQLGYKFFLDQSLEYRAIKHDRLSAAWDEKYKLGCEYYLKCIEEIKQGKRLRIDYL